MPSFFIDTSSNRIVFALIFDNNLKVKTILTFKNMTEVFISELNQFLKENKVEIKDIDKLFVINGPGNFSSIRIGCIFANTIKLLGNCSIYYLSSCLFSKSKSHHLPIIDAKSKKFYFSYKNEILMEEIQIINKIAVKENWKIINDYLNYDFESCWKFNKDKFKKTDQIRPDYIKKAL